MYYHEVCGCKLSALGFGMMRLPLRADGTIDEPLVAQMVRLAIEGGVNYFDTAYPYHQGESERVTGRVLRAYPRESFHLASKFPGHMPEGARGPAAIFEEQLEKCGVDYFDFYLLHNVSERSMAFYTDPAVGCLDYFLEQKRLGRIRHLGFSCHAKPEGLEQFLDYADGRLEFCQIQLNYLDWTLQDAKRKCDILAAHNMPVWVMEPVRGGRLAVLPGTLGDGLLAAQPDKSIPSWAFRWLQGLDNLGMILSGMSTSEQVADNLHTFAAPSPLTEAENAQLMDIAERLKGAVPCTGCRYCCDGCPAGLDIPALLRAENDLRFGGSPDLTALPSDRRADACLGCGQCASVCPQKIDVPAELRKLAARGN